MLLYLFHLYLLLIFSIFPPLSDRSSWSLSLSSQTCTSPHTLSPIAHPSDDTTLSLVPSHSHSGAHQTAPLVLILHQSASVLLLSSTTKAIQVDCSDVPSEAKNLSMY